MSPNNRIPAKLDTGLLPPEVDSSTFVWFTAVVDVTEQATNLPRFSDLCVSSKSYAPSCFANETLRDPVFGSGSFEHRESTLCEKHVRLMLLDFVTTIEIVDSRSAGF
jgi:hypothetical protein